MDPNSATNYLKKLLTFIKNHKRILLIIFISLSTIIISVNLVIFFLTHSWFPLANENLLSAVPSTKVNEFKFYLESRLEDLGYSDVKDVTIRENSVSTTEESYLDSITTYFTNFLIDIDSIQQTYAVTLLWFNEPTNADDTITISCPKLSESKYPEFECNSPSGSNHTIDLWLPHEFTLDTGEKVIVKNSTFGQKGKILQIYLYSCDDYNPPIDTTAEIVKTWTKDTVKDPFADKYHYNVRYGYCSE